MKSETRDTGHGSTDVDGDDLMTGSGAYRAYRPDEEGLPSVLALIQSEFASMDGVVDPPSSVHRLTVEALVAGPGEVWAIGSPPAACIVMTPRLDVLHVGKLAVATTERGKGLARGLLDQATARARDLGLGWLELQTRIELVANHRIFEAMGFVETERTAHPGFERVTSITYRRAVQP